MPFPADCSPSAILVFLPNWLGDAVMCTPALRALKRRYPEARITAAGKGACCAVLEGFPWADRLLPLPERPGLFKSLALRASLRAESPELAVIFPHAFRAAWLAWLSGASERIGLDRGGRRFLLTRVLPRYTVNGRAVPRYTALEYLDIAALADASDDGQGLELAADPAEIAAFRARVEPGRRLVGIAPGAAFGPSKRWLPERFAAVADTLQREHNAQCLLMTGPGEEETRDAVLRAAQTPLVEYHGGAPSIARLKAAIASVDLLIGNDSGPRHIAIAFKKPVVCIMGSTSPAYTESPWERGEVLRVDVDCGPCQKPHCVTDHRCMTGVTVECTVAAAAKWLDMSSPVAIH
jgi:heptosyltransferase-2